MSNHGPFQLRILACPEDQRAAALGVINEHSLSREWGSMGGNNEALAIGEEYVDDEAALDLATDIAHALAEAAPGSIFIGWSEPKHEWLGDVVMHTPELGLFTAPCDAHGNVVLTATQVRKAIGLDPTAPAALALTRLLGTPWDDALAAYSHPPRR